MAVRGITLVQLILERRPYGEDGPKWYHRWTFKLIVVLQINLSDGILRLAFVHCLPCNMLWWAPDVTIGWKKLRSSEDTAESLQWLNVVINKIRCSDFDLIIDTSYDRPIAGNLLFVFEMNAHFNRMIHISPDMCSQAAKNFLKHLLENTNREGRNGLRKNDFLDIWARNTRRHLTNPNENQDDLKTIVSTRPTVPLSPLYHGPVRLDKLMNVWRTPTPCLAVMC